MNTSAYSADKMQKNFLYRINKSPAEKEEKACFNSPNIAEH